MQHKKLLIGVLAIALLVGVVFASYTFFSATVNVNVAEPFTFGINYVGWAAPPGADMIAGYYSQASPLTCSIALRAGESSHGNPDVPEAIRDLMPILTKGDVPAVGPPPWGVLHTFNSMQVANDAGVPLTVTFAVYGESADVYLVAWEETTVWKLNAWSYEVPANGFIMRGIGVVAEADAAPGAYTFTVYVTRG